MVLGNLTISIYVSEEQFFKLIEKERIKGGPFTCFVLKHLCRTNAKGWYALNCKGIKPGMKDMATKKLIENFVKANYSYLEARIEVFASWRYKDSNNLSGNAFILVKDPKLASGLILISGNIKLAKLDTVLLFEKYEYKK